MFGLRAYALVALGVSWPAATAAPTWSCGSSGGGQCPAVEVNANFDDLSPVPGAPDLSGVPTPYKGLFYQSFGFGQPGMGVSSQTPVIQAHSPSSVGVTSNNRQMTAGTPMITVNYPNSNTRSFSLESFYFSCTLSTFNNLVAPPQACLVTITGYQTTASDNQVSAATQVCSQQFIYNPSTVTGPQQMAFSGPVNSCFKDLQFAILQYSPPGGMAVEASNMGLELDDVKYSYRNTTCSSPSC